MSDAVDQLIIRLLLLHFVYSGQMRRRLFLEKESGIRQQTHWLIVTFDKKSTVYFGTMKYSSAVRMSRHAAFGFRKHELN